MSSFTNLFVYSNPHAHGSRAFTKISILESVYVKIRLQAVYVWTAVAVLGRAGGAMVPGPALFVIQKGTSDDFGPGPRDP